MSDPTPRPERVTLTDEIAGEVWAWFNRHDAPWSPSDATVNDLAFRIEGNVLAAREQALREKHERIVADLKSCWKVDMRDARERGEALARVEALAFEWETSLRGIEEPDDWYGDRLRAALRGETR